MRIPEQVSLFSVSYVKKLKNANRGLLLAIGFIIGASGYQMHHSYQLHSAKSNEIAALSQEIDSLQSELSELQEFKDAHEARVKRVSSFIQSANPRIPESEAMSLARWEIKHANRQGVRLDVSLAISKKESRWDCKAVSPTGPIGCKQIAYRWWGPQFGVSRAQLFDPETNIRLGAKIIRRLYDMTGSYESALRRYQGTGDPTSDAEYARDVLRIASSLRKVV